VEGKVEEVKKEKNEVKERARKAQKEKDEAESMAQKTQAVIQKLYKEMPEVSDSSRSYYGREVLKIGKVIKGFQSNIEDLQLQSTPGMPPEVREGRERMMMTTVTNIKKIEEECTKLCEESTKYGQT
jgi:uncharacterized protein (DUF3084 family)